MRETLIDGGLSGEARVRRAASHGRRVINVGDETLERFGAKRRDELTLIFQHVIM